LAGQIVRGGGFGLIGDLIVGAVGAFIGDWLLPQLNIHLGVGTVALIVNATIGAVVLLIIIRIIAGNRGWGGGVWQVRMTPDYFSADSAIYLTELLPPEGLN